MGFKLVEWLLFSVGLGCAPLIADVGTMLAGEGIDWISYFSRGDLFIVGAVLCGTALGRLVVSGSAFVGWRLVSGWGCALTLFVSGWLFVALCRGGSGPSERLAITAIVVFVISTFCSSTAIVISGD